MCCRALLRSGAIPGLSADAPSRHLTLDPTPASPRRARAFVAAATEDLGADIADTVLLLTSELVTNGVLHARTTIELGVTRGDDTLLVTVGDRNAEQPRQPEPDDARPSGRGLMLVTALATEWGVHWADGGKVAWFTLSVPSAASGGSPLAAAQ